MALALEDFEALCGFVSFEELKQVGGLGGLCVIVFDRCSWVCRGKAPRELSRARGDGRAAARLEAAPGPPRRLPTAWPHAHTLPPPPTQTPTHPPTHPPTPQALRDQEELRAVVGEGPSSAFLEAEGAALKPVRGATGGRAGERLAGAPPGAARPLSARAQSGRRAAAAPGARRPPST
jgi:hypothetical protein